MNGKNKRRWPDWETYDPAIYKRREFDLGANMARMSFSMLRVYDVLRWRRNDKGEAWPGYKDISKVSGCSKGRVGPAEAGLVKLGAILVFEQKTKKGRRNRYIVFRTASPAKSIATREGNAQIETNPPAPREGEGCARIGTNPCAQIGTNPYLRIGTTNSLIRTQAVELSTEHPPPPPSRGCGQSSEASARPLSEREEIEADEKINEARERKRRLEAFAGGVAANMNERKTL